MQRSHARSPPRRVVTFVLVPSTATQIFKTFLCDSFDYEDESLQTRRYLHDDLALACASWEYQETRTIAIVMILVWPVGGDEQGLALSRAAQAYSHN
jgi:hypothetical protein